MDVDVVLYTTLLCKEVFLAGEINAILLSSTNKSELIKRKKKEEIKIRTTDCLSYNENKTIIILYYCKKGDYENY